MVADKDGRRLPVAPTAGAGARILLVTSVRLLRDGLAGMLQRRFGAQSVCLASGSESALVAMAEFAPTLILLDVATDDGLAIAAALSTQANSAQILGFAARAHDHDLLAYAQAGIAGFVPREASIRELFDAISRASRGELLCSPRLAAILFRKLGELATGRAPQPTTADPGGLTDRELEIVRCIDEGLSNKQIARHLRIKISTVKNHVHHILEKLHVARRGEAAARVRTTPAAMPAAKRTTVERSIRS